MGTIAFFGLGFQIKRNLAKKRVRAGINTDVI
ncbi:MAG: hypothetical protein JO235_20185 [Chroococcidiopsidaceae cyanobacterium CP_BM_RX_35]|nr:hypothetical protein [Chroococcidiopsidaceae cyanobacterium CP_BM_RX_35]